MTPRRLLSRRRLGSAAGLAAAAVIAPHAIAFNSDASLTPVAPGEATITLSLSHGHPGSAVPRRFLGLSFEVSSLPLIARYAHRGDLVRLLRSLGPGVLRFGGISADSTTWAGARTTDSLWPARTISPVDLRDLAVLARRTGWRVLLTVNLARYDPRAAASEVAVAHRALGGSLAAVELGNEPDAYGRHGVRALPWDFARYETEVEAYRRQITALTPGVTLAGPDVSGSGGGAIRQWVDPAARRPIGLLTGHYYSLGCRDASPPTIAELLSDRTRAEIGRSLERYVTAARAASLPFRVDEVNSVSCGGQAGVSNTFASGLWAVDYLVRAMAAGAVGVNLHGHLENCDGYTPLCAPTPERLFTDALSVAPEWYALLFAEPLIGDRPVRPMTSSPEPGVDIAVFDRHDGGAHVVIVDAAAAGTAPLRIDFRGAARFARASLVTLSAPSLAATAGVTLGGRGVSYGGRWSGPRPLRLEVSRGGAVAVSVRASTATLLTLLPRTAHARRRDRGRP